MATICKITIGDEEETSKKIPSRFIYEIGLHEDESFLNVVVNKDSYSNVEETTKLSSITLGNDEYVSEVEYRFDQSIDLTYLKFTTNYKNCVEAGRMEDEEFQNCKLENMRLLEIGGECKDGFVNKLYLMFIKNYVPSVKIATNENFILAYSPPSTEFEAYTNPFERNIDCYQNIMAYMMTRNYSLSVETEFFLKAAASLGIELNNPNGESQSYRLTALRSHLDEQIAKLDSKKKTITVSEGQVGVKLVTGDIMKGPDGTIWMYPTSVMSYSMMKQSGSMVNFISNLSKYYDLTGQICTQIADLHNLKTISNSYVYYMP